MIKDYVNEIKELQSSHVYIKSKDVVNKLINDIVNGGPNKLQVVSDFDRTITKQYEDGKEYFSSFAIIGKCPSVTERYLLKEKENTSKFRPIEMDPNLSINEKIEDMEKWWRLSEFELKGLKIPKEEIDKVVYEVGPVVRDGSTELFQLLKENKVPVLVFSAGLGDTVEAVLEHCGVLHDNVKVISNYLKYTDDGTIEGFLHDTLIHVFNKNEFALKNTKYYDIIRDRDNVILMGDSLGDSSMADGISHANAILKIGFLYEHKEENLPQYMDKFDIVLDDDQTMNVIISILNRIM